MSILSSLIHGEIHNKPNDVHNRPEDADMKIYTPGSILSAEAQRRTQAMQSGAVKPDLYYTEEEQVPWHGKLEEPPHAVESKLESKEEFPQG